MMNLLIIIVITEFTSVTIVIIISKSIIHFHVQNPYHIVHNINQAISPRPFKFNYRSLNKLTKIKATSGMKQHTKVILRIR